VLVSIISGLLVVGIVVGLAVYFLVYYEPEDEVTKFTNKLAESVQSGYGKIKDVISKLN